MFINENGNDEANEAVQMILHYIAENPGNKSFGFSVELKQVNGNRSEPIEFLQRCKLIFSQNIF